MVYTRVYSSLLGRRYTLGFSTPRTRILLSSAYAPPRPYPRTMVISCVSPARGTYSHILPISMVLGQKVNSPLITHSISNIPRASQRSYRECLSALTESVPALLPRAFQRSYREWHNALTESGTTLLPRAPQRSYREHSWGHYYPSGRALRMCVTDPVRKLPPQPSSCPSLSRSDTAPTAEGRASQTALLPLSEGRASGGGFLAPRDTLRRSSRLSQIGEKRSL